MEQHYHPLNVFLAAYTLICGFIGSHFTHLLGDFSLVMGAVLQITSFITFIVFMTLNYHRFVNQIIKIYNHVRKITQ